MRMKEKTFSLLSGQLFTIYSRRLVQSPPQRIVGPVAPQWRALLLLWCDSLAGGDLELLINMRAPNPTTSHLHFSFVKQRDTGQKPNFRGGKKQHSEASVHSMFLSLPGLIPLREVLFITTPRVTCALQLKNRKSTLLSSSSLLKIFAYRRVQIYH